MVLVDTSVWVTHLRKGEQKLEFLLNEGHVFIHPYIIGELACGNLNNRNTILSLLHALPSAIPADHEEVMHFIENKGLMGHGLGYIDIHLLVSSILSDLKLWTLDKKLHHAAFELGLAY